MGHRQASGLHFKRLSALVHTFRQQQLPPALATSPSYSKQPSIAATDSPVTTPFDQPSSTAPYSH